MNAQIFVSCFQWSAVPAHPLLLPVQAGAARGQTRYPGMCGDDTGDNISARNSAYCELTVQYWAWKNVQKAYYGLMHNRRYFDFSGKKRRLQGDGMLHLPFPDAAALRELGYDRAEAWIAQYELILPLPQDVRQSPMQMTVREQFAANHDPACLEEMLAVLSEQQSDYLPDAQQYLSGHQAIFYNMFLMSRPLFMAYCEWLFPLLFALEKRLKLAQRSAYQQRMLGFLAERLLGIYVTHLRRVSPKVRIAFLPVAFFEQTDPAVPPQRHKKAPSAYLLPLGSRRRRYACMMVRRMHDLLLRRRKNT